MTNNLTPEDRDKFYGYVKDWQIKLGLQKWNLVRDNRKTSNLSEVHFDADDSHRLAKIRLGNNWKSTAVTEHNLESTAFHELLHILLHDLIEHSRAHPFEEDKIREKEHEVINSIENLMFPK